MQNRPRIHSLNGLRAVSVLIVAASHCGFGNIVPGGLGVTVFFFLSGFLITQLLIEEFAQSRTIGLPSFYTKRFFRLTPPLLAMLALSATLVAVGALPGHITLAGMAAETFYFTNYYSLFWDTGDTTAAGTGILWSLAVEEHFYCLYPVALLVLLRRFSKRTIFWMIALTCLAVLAWRMKLAGAPGFDASRTYYSTDTRIDSILYGCLLALGWNPLARSAALRVRTAPMSRLLLCAGLLLLCLTLVVRSPYFRETFRYSLQGLALLPLFHWVLTTERGALHGFLNHPTVSKLGEYSYAFYLFHFVVANLLTANTRLGETPGALFATVTLISIGVAAAIHFAVERPSQRLRGRVLAMWGIETSPVAALPAARRLAA